MFIDSHTHITWGLDDGIQSLEECKMALKMAKEDGIECIIGTPHLIPGKACDCFIERMQEVGTIAQSYGISYFTGSEIYLNDQYMEVLNNKSYIPLANSRYILIEFDVHHPLQEESKVEDRLYECCIVDLVPIIAHAERYFLKKMDLDRVKNWRSMGCKIQVNRTSLLGLHGKRIQKNAFSLLKAGYVDIVASDSHTLDGNRITKLSDVYKVIEKYYGKENADLLTYKNPKRIIENQELNAMIQRKKNFYFRKEY